MNPQNDMRRYIMEAMQQHGQQLSPRFAKLLQAMQGQQQQAAGMMPGTGQLPDQSTGLLENDPRNSQIYAQRRAQNSAMLDTQRQKAALLAMDRGDLNNIPRR